MDRLRGAVVNDVPETRYAKTPEGVHIAYQTLGDGPRDIVFSPYIGAIDVIWDEPSFARVLRRLADMGRLICFDPRGIGASDPVPLGALPTPEAWIDDLRTVLDTVGSTKANIIGHGFVLCMSMLFAATYPERVDSLVLVECYARAAWAEDYPIGWPLEVCQAMFDLLDQAWGTGFAVPFLAPSRVGDETFRRWSARWEREGGSPAVTVAFMRWLLDFDVRSLLSTIHAPTLVMHHHLRSRLFPVAFSEYLAEHIPGARLKVVPGSDVFYFTDASDEVVDEIEEFITGAPPVREPDRALATVLFTDIVNSTPKQAEVGDARWRQLLDRHDDLVRRELDRHRGRQVKTTGDGVLATFDGPARAIRCTQAILGGLSALGLDVRAGLHTGEVELRNDDVTGLAVTIGRRVSDLAGPSEVLVSSTVKDLVAGSGIVFADRGTHMLKGVPDEWRLFAVES